MYEHKNLSIATVAITIKVVQVNGHKMTKATFRQIQCRHLQEWPGDENIIGWVKDRVPQIIWTENGKLFRASVENWETTLKNGTRIPVTERLEQLFIAT